MRSRYFDHERFIAGEIKRAVDTINHRVTYQYPNGKDANYLEIVKEVRRNPRFSGYSPETITRAARKMAEKGVLMRTSPGKYCLPENFQSHQFI